MRMCRENFGGFIVMNRDELTYLAPYLLSLLISVGIFFYAWQHRYIRGARPFTWLVGGQALTTLGFIFELVSANLETKMLWDTFQWLTSAFLVVLPFLAFAVQFSEHKLSAPSITWGMIIAFPVLFTVFLLTDPIHHLFYSNPRLSTAVPFPELTYDFTWQIYLYLLLYVYGAYLFGIALLMIRAFQPQVSFRQQYLIVALGFLLPFVFSILTLSEVQFTPQRDLTPVASAIGHLIAAWGLFHYGLFDILPIAREHLFESITDPVIVLDPRNRITDVNQAALTLLQKQREEILGRTPKVALTDWPSLTEAILNPFVERKEVSMMRGDNIMYFEVNLSPIFDNNREPVGRLVLARDITKLKTLEKDHRSLSNEMEQQVEKRIKE
jgi:PAS domain S-box-containing protein